MVRRSPISGIMSIFLKVSQRTPVTVPTAVLIAFLTFSASRFSIKLFTKSAKALERSSFTCPSPRKAMIVSAMPLMNLARLEPMSLKSSSSSAPTTISFSLVPSRWKSNVDTQPPKKSHAALNLSAISRPNSLAYQKSSSPFSATARSSP